MSRGYPLRPPREPQEAEEQETGHIVPPTSGNEPPKAFYVSDNSKRKRLRNDFLVRNSIRILGNYKELTIRELAKKLDEETRYSPTTQQLGAILRKSVTDGTLGKYIHVKTSTTNAIYFLSVK